MTPPGVATPPVEPVELGGVRLTPAGIQPVAAHVSTWIAADDVHDVSLRYGFRAAHPLLAASFELALVVPGGLVAWHVHHWWQHGGTLIAAEMWLAVPAVLGCALVFEAGRRGYYLLVHLQRGRRKVPFSSGSTRSTADRFCAALRVAGYKVVDEAN